MSIPFLTRTLINSLGSKGSASRASSLVGDVTIVSQGSNALEASVTSSSGYGDYEVSVEWEDDDEDSLDCNCTCPDQRGGFCKHSCAVLLYLLQGGGGSVRASSPKSSAPKFSPPKTTTTYGAPPFSFDATSIPTFSSSSTPTFSSSPVASGLSGVGTLPWNPPAPKSHARTLWTQQEALSLLQQYRSQSATLANASRVAEALLGAASIVAEKPKHEAYEFLDRVTSEWATAHSRGFGAYSTVEVAACELANLWLRLLLNDQSGDPYELRSRVQNHNLRHKMSSWAGMLPSSACFQHALALVNAS